MHTDLKAFCVAADSSVRDVIACMDSGRLGIVLIVSNERKLYGTVTDGDLRRAILAGLEMDAPVSRLLEMKAGTRFARPITARALPGGPEHLDILQRHNILHLPIVDEEDRVVGLVIEDDFTSAEALPIHAVIMAGGAGKRLMPLTVELPKPMLSVGDRPLLEIIVGQLRDAGVKHVHIATHHKTEKISDHFGNGQDFGIEVEYVIEDHPMGTAGALSLMDEPTQTVLVINGDILTGLDIRRILSFHREQHADLTVAVRQYDIQVPYGVVECEGATVQRLTEKPVVKFYVNAGIYLLEPSVYRFLPHNEPFDMTDLIQRLLDAGSPVCSFPIREYWLDIGQHSDYEKAKEHMKEMEQRS